MADTHNQKFYIKLPDASSENELASKIRELDENEKLNEVLNAIEDKSILPSKLRIVKKIKLNKQSLLKVFDVLLDLLELQNTNLIIQSMIEMLGAKNTLTLMRNRAHTKTSAIVNSWYHLSGHISKGNNPKYLILLNQVFEAIRSNYHNLNSEDKVYWDGLLKDSGKSIH